MNEHGRWSRTSSDVKPVLEWVGTEIWYENANAYPWIGKTMQSLKANVQIYKVIINSEDIKSVKWLQLQLSSLWSNVQAALM